MLHDFFFLVHPVTAFKRGPHGRLVFAKCVIPSVNKVYYYYYYFYSFSFLSQSPTMLCCYWKLDGGTGLETDVRFIKR